MRKRSFLPLCMAAVLTVSAAAPAVQAYAAVGPGQTEEPVPDGVTEEQWGKLNDQSIEFGELPDLVRYFNPSVKNISTQVSDGIDSYRYIYEKMRGYVKDLRDDADQAKDSGEMTTVDGMTVPLYMVLDGTADAVGTQADKIGRGLEVMERSDSSVNSNITYAAKNYTYYANQIMIGYNSALTSRDLLQKASELSTAAYDTQNLSFQLGMATEADMLSAHKGVLSAQASLLSLDNTIDSLRRSLYLMTGYSSDSTAAIGTVPELDMAALSAIDLEADTAKAIGNNYDLIKERHAASDQSTTGMKNKDDSVSQSEQTIRITMQSYYQAVQQAKSAYDAACTAYERATLEKGKADRSYQLGMLGKINYLQAQMAFLQAESGKQSAYNTLYQAWDTYQWAADGIIMTSSQAAPQA